MFKYIPFFIKTSGKNKIFCFYSYRFVLLFIGFYTIYIFALHTLLRYFSYER